MKQLMSKQKEMFPLLELAKHSAKINGVTSFKELVHEEKEEQFYNSAELKHKKAHDTFRQWAKLKNLSLKKF
jgi:hypothetical protein